MERRVRGNSHARCGVGERPEIISGAYLSLLINSITKYDNVYLHTGNEKSKLQDIEEKRRLLFVSLTRAKDELYVTGQYVCFSSKENGETYNRYLKEVFDVTDTPYVPIDPNAAAKKAAKLKAQTTLVDKAKSKAAKAKKSYSSVKKSNKNKTA